MRGRLTASTRPLVLLAVLVLVPVASAVGVTGVAAAQIAQEETPDSVPCGFPLELTDATGTTVTVESDPERIVALQPSAAQTMWEIGAREEVVGMPVNRYTSYLDGHDRPGNVVSEDEFTVNVEAVVELEPDLVLSPNVTPTDTVAQLRNAGLTVYHFGAAESIDDVYDDVLLSGRLTGNCEGAEERAASMRDRVDRVGAAVEDEPRPSVLYPLGGGVVAGSDTFLHELITTAGSNLAADSGIEGYGQLSAEVVVDRDPQWVIWNEGLPRSEIEAYEGTTAVEEDQVIRVDPNYANQPAPRVAIVVEEIARALHPEAMAAVEGTVTPGGDATTVARSPATGAEAPGQPGLGLAAGVLAIALAALSLVRRAP